MLFFSSWGVLVEFLDRKILSDRVPAPEFQIRLGHSAISTGLSVVSPPTSPPTTFPLAAVSALDDPWTSRLSSVQLSALRDCPSWSSWMRLLSDFAKDGREGGAEGKGGWEIRGGSSGRNSRLSCGIQLLSSGHSSSSDWSLLFPPAPLFSEVYTW